MLGNWKPEATPWLAGAHTHSFVFSLVHRVNLALHVPHEDLALRNTILSTVIYPTYSQINIANAQDIGQSTLYGDLVTILTSRLSPPSSLRGKKES
jgi:hypothetical protein